jgi:hypothetical protein
MQGYVQNNGSTPVFIAQRGVPQGASVDFEKLHLTYAKKSGFEELEPGFVQWLRDNVFSDTKVWGFYNFDGSEYEFATPEKEEKPAPKKKTARKKKAAAKKVEEVAEKPAPKKEARGAGKRLARKSTEARKGASITPSTIIEAEYTIAKPLIEKCNDREVLKKALTLSRHFSSKEQHMRHLMRRLEQVY